MKKMRFESTNEFVLGKYVKREDAKPKSAFTEEQIMNALGRSKIFNVRDWFGSVDEVTFTITKIEKTDYGEYIYTVESTQQIPDRFFPTVYEICWGDNVAAPISLAILY
jgi:hypothetical protein